MPLYRRSLIAHFLLVIALPLLLAATHARAAAADFPLYPVIADNVRFWEKIYGVYSHRQAVIHDAEDLSKVYEVVQLVDPEEAGARLRNAALQKAACEKYRGMLARLAQQQPATREEQRIAAMFPGKEGRRAMAAAAQNVRSQTGLKERFYQGVLTSRLYLAEIRKIFRDYGLPEELAHLPHVESSFNVKAYSRVGAAGLWQFTRETGKQYMTIDSSVDLRLDPIAATHAAAQYLKKSHQALDNWPLALTSYNYGLAGMMRAVAEEGSYEGVFSRYRKGYFKFAARNFYAEFLAARNVATEHEKALRFDRPMPAPHRYQTLKGSISLRELARHFSLSIETLAELNPALRPPVLRGEKRVPGGYVLRLPAAAGRGQSVAATPAPAPAPTPAPTPVASAAKENVKATLTHVVQRGDTAHNIARRHRISVQSLIEANKLDSRATIRLGQSLLIPGRSEPSDGKKAGGDKRMTSRAARQGAETRAGRDA